MSAIIHCIKKSEPLPHPAVANLLQINFVITNNDLAVLNVLLSHSDPELGKWLRSVVTGVPAYGLRNPRVVPLTVAGQPFSSVLQHIGALIDLYQRDAKVLTQLGIQDMLYRHIAMMLQPEAFLPQPELPRTTSAALVARLCDYMHAHMEAGVTMTDLEAFSGLSARSLQLAFKKHLDCTPMQWLTRQKLHTIRTKLLNAKPFESVTSLAGTHFPNQGDFARYYQRQFGELPSQTLARQRR